MPSSKPLYESYICCGQSLEIYTKTGIYIEELDYSLFLRDDISEVERFSVSSHVIKRVGADIGDRISITMFTDDGSVFLIYNHTRKQHHYFEEAVRDLSYNLGKRTGWIGQIVLILRLKNEAALFPNTITFSSILRKVMSL